MYHIYHYTEGANQSVLESEAVAASAGGSSEQSAAVTTTASPTPPAASHSTGESDSTVEAAGELPPLSRIRDLNSFFKMGPGGFTRNPETFAFVHLQKFLSNIKWVCTHLLHLQE